MPCALCPVHCGVVVRALDMLISGRGFESSLGAYALRQGILSTIVSLDPGVVNGYPAGIYSFEMLMSTYIGSSAKAGVIIH